MREHVMDLLNAYLDGELPALKRMQVEKHLEECETCRAELESLNALSDILQSAPVPAAPTPVERFASQVMLCLPQHPNLKASGLRSTSNTLLWLIPIGVLSLWVFLQVIWLVSGFLEIGLAAGIFQALEKWVAPSPNPLSWILTEDLLNSMLSFFGKGPLEITGRETAWLYHMMVQAAIEVELVILYWAGLSVWMHRNRRFQN